MTQRVKAAALIATALVVLAAIGWPAGLGGSTTYLAIRGASMRPAVAAGDFAVIRSGGPYRIGEVAAYRSATVHHVVLHRIAAIEGDTYTFKGDANSFNDPEQVPRSAIVGRLSVRVPHLGGALLWLSHPFNALLLLLALTMLWWDRSRLRSLLLGGEATAVVLGEPVLEELPPSTWDVGIDPDRVVTIRDLSFPHELAVADVVEATDLTRLAERYDRPILHDAASDVLFVVEAGMLYRCAVPAEASLSVPATLSIVRDEVVLEEAAPEFYDDAEPYEALAADDETELADELAAYDEAGLYDEVTYDEVTHDEVTYDEVAYDEPLPAAPSPAPSRRRKWYDRPPADRRHTPQGRDWRCASAPVHAPRTYGT
jgi:signal peptidase I